MKTLQRLYRLIAPVYEQKVIPAFGPLAEDLVAWLIQGVGAHLQYALHDPFDLPEVQPHPAMYRLSAVDIGTGTGILARALGKHLGLVTGIDLSVDMLLEARQAAARQDLERLRFMLCDAHHLALRRASIDLVVSSFGFNATTPKQSLKAVAQLLRPGKGVLAFQEWGAEDNCETILDDTLREFAPDVTPGIEADYQEYFATRKPWYDHLQDTEDYYEMLKGMGFDLVWVKEARFVTVHFPSLATFLSAKCAWPSRALYLEAMTPTVHAAFQAEVGARLATFLNTDGSLDWSPPLFRVFAIR